MKLKEIVLKNFRGYLYEVRIPIDDLTVLIGKNDVGKSTVLEAMNIFFNEKDAKMDSSDACVHCGNDRNVTIGCVFDDLPDSLSIDVSARTTLEAEYLLNGNGHLEIYKVIDCNGTKPKTSIFVLANHPSATKYDDLMSLKNTDLKKRIREFGIEEEHVDLNSNVSMRNAIWKHCPDLQLSVRPISLEKGEDVKALWNSLSIHFPIYALFKADRQSSDEDDEVQDPMKLAIAEALREVENRLDDVKQAVRNKVLDVATRTLAKLNDMDPTLASELSPNFKVEPKWDGLFKLSLTSDDQIPINKRGSGVRRMILLNFFRAEVERRIQTEGINGVIYAIEEPETAQHPDNQRMIIETLKELSQQPNCQIILTTHVPGLAQLVPKESIRYISKDGTGRPCVGDISETTIEQVVEALGVLPDVKKLSPVKLMICVEGVHDISCLKSISEMLHQHNPSEFLNISNDERIILIPLGGSTLKEWASQHYLQRLGIPEWHLYDRDIGTSPKYQRDCDNVNNRSDRSSARLTEKRELENYIHHDVIQEVFGVTVSFTGNDDVPMLVAKAVHENAPGVEPWNSLKEKAQSKKESRVKVRLNTEAAGKMTVDLLDAIDSIEEVKSWFRDINARIIST